MHINKQKLRLTTSEISVIKSSINSFDEQAKIYLFGSRVDDKLKGGDIDLLVLSEKILQRDTYLLKAKIFRTLEEQKIDIIIKKQPDDAFTKYIFKQAIEL